MGPSKDRREEGMDLRRQQRARDAEAAEASRRRHAEALRKKAEQEKGGKK
jgi:hypothetical protein